MLIRRDKDMQHLGGTNAVDDFYAGGVAPERAGGCWQRLACGDTAAQLRLANLVTTRGQGAIRGGCGEHHRGAIVANAFQQLRRTGLFQQHGGRAHRERKQQQTAQAEGEGQRRAANEHVVDRGLEHMARPAGAGGHHVAVEVHGGLGHAGGAGGEGHHAGIVHGGIYIRKVHRIALHGGLQPIGFCAAKMQHVL